jgi:recombining binding protein (suppressor of hairless)
MTIDHAQLCASNIAWSAFNVNVVSRPTDTPSMGMLTRDANFLLLTSTVTCRWTPTSAIWL